MQQTHEWEQACVAIRRSMFARRRRLVGFDIRSRDRVLDLGCGDGLNIMILRDLGVSRITGVDISPYLLAAAKRNNPGIRVLKASAGNLPFRPKSFDVVLVDSVFHHLMSWEKPLREIRRVLVSGGRLCFIEPHKSLLRGILDWISLQPVSGYIPGLSARALAYQKERELMRHWLRNEARFIGLLDRVGFHRLRLRTDILSIVGVYGT